MFSLSLQVTGRPVAAEWPLAFGPRNSGQLMGLAAVSGVKLVQNRIRSRSNWNLGWKEIDRSGSWSIHRGKCRSLHPNALTRGARDVTVHTWSRIYIVLSPSEPACQQAGGVY